MKYYIIAGEASGDLHAAALVHELKKTDKNAVIRAWGGDLLQQQGVTLVKHYRETAFMGFLTVALNIRMILRNIRFCKKDILAYRPDVLILVDYPGFNLKMAKFAKKYGINIFYYISPKIWAWKKWRIKTIKKFVDKMYVILPFEEDFYKQNGYKAYYVGNPLVDAIEKRKCKNETFVEFVKRNKLSGKPIIALLPGSRKQEIENMLPVMSEVTAFFPDYEFVIAGTSIFDKSFYDSYTKKKSFSILFDQVYAILQQSKAAVVASGTATLETALLSIPQVVVYKQKGGIIVAKIAKLVYSNFFSLINLIAEKEVVKELFMYQVTTNNISKELSLLLSDKEYRKRMLAEYEHIYKKLGKKNAAQRAAQLMFAHLSD